MENNIDPDQIYLDSLKPKIVKESGTVVNIEDKRPTGFWGGQSNIKSMQIEAVIIRADGRREPLGVISYYHRNIFKRWWFSISSWFKRVYKKLTGK